MRFSLFLRAACALLVMPVIAPHARAEDSPRISGVVELFTSQSCNSCPPADAVLAELGKRGDVMVLAYHVDYWDYLGWRDMLGTPENTERQRLYMRALRGRAVYTPQAVVNGRVHMIGSNRDGLLHALKEMALAGAGPSVPLTVSRSGDGIAIEAGAAKAGDGEGIGEAALLLVVFGAPVPVRIATGENEGRTVTYWNPVSSVRPVGLWRRQTARVELPLSALGEGKGAAVLLQALSRDGLPGAILGAAVIRQPGTR